ARSGRSHHALRRTHKYPFLRVRFPPSCARFHRYATLFYNLTSMSGGTPGGGSGGGGGGGTAAGGTVEKGGAAAGAKQLAGEWSQSLQECAMSNESASGGLTFLRSLTSGGHRWSSSSHNRPTFCNVCREKFTGVPWHGMACEICKMKVHKRCAEAVRECCKWTMAESIPAPMQYINPENSIGPHQWLQGNLPMGSRCAVCEKACGSVLKLQDLRCLWCAQCVHDSCESSLPRYCLLGTSALSVLPPIALERVDKNGRAKIRDDAVGGDYGGGSPLLVIVNSKSGDNQGSRLIRKLRRLLNPIQVFDLIACGPEFPLTFFSHFDTFRVLVCGGDGTVGWVLTAIDKLAMHNKVQLGVLPLGTGNDLARVMGWGHSFYNDARLPNLIRTYERAHTRMLDRWSIMAIEGVDPTYGKMHDQIAAKVTAFMHAEAPHDVFAAIKDLGVCVHELILTMQSTYDQVESWERQFGRNTEDPLTDKFRSLMTRLNPLIKELNEVTTMEESGVESADSAATEEERARRERLVLRANSFKKTIMEVLEFTEKTVDRHNREARHGSAAAAKRDRFRKKRSKTTPSALKVSGSNVSSGSAYSPPASPSVISPSRQPRVSLGASVDSHTNPLATARDLRTQRPIDEQDDVEEEEGATEEEEEEAGPSYFVHPPTPCSSRLDDSYEQEKAGGRGDGDRGGQEGGRGDEKRKEEKEGKDEVGRTEGRREMRQSTSDGGLYLGRKRSEEEGRSASSTAEEEEETAEEEGIAATTATGAAGDMLSPSGGSAVKRRGRPQTHSGVSLPCGSSLSTASSSFTGGVCGSGGRYIPSTERQRQSTFMDRLPALKKGILSSGLTGGTLIAEMLMLSANVLKTPTALYGDVTHESLPDYKELKVMNNYFGIGLDAKIALDFHNKRESTDKQRSRSKLFMWYGILGGRELLHQTYRNLDQRIRLECDGLPIDLPSLQVVALFGVVHVASGRIPNVVRLQNHRIAQCRHVKITIHGEEPIPVQVDGEPWMQPPGVLQFVHKNRAQMLVKNAQSFDASLRTWEEHKSVTAPSTPTALNTTLPQDGDRVPFSRRAAAFVSTIESEMAHLGLTAKFLDTLEHTATVVRRAEHAEQEVKDCRDTEDRG
ncbi:dgk-4, partial [Pristionchus pacificus]|uniref:Diacylglycerol kinase n=1 Tax=Pristionchus pacificus TaxID=54126 RepID=A0A2A6BWT2_PRIPA